MGWERIAENRIREAMQQGEFDNLPGAGKPIDLDGYFKLPEHLRVAFSLLKNANCVPVEVELLNEIAALERRLSGAVNDDQRSTAPSCARRSAHGAGGRYSSAAVEPRRAADAEIVRGAVVEDVRRRTDGALRRQPEDLAQPARRVPASLHQRRCPRVHPVGPQPDAGDDVRDCRRTAKRSAASGSCCATTWSGSRRRSATGSPSRSGAAASRPMR